MNRRSLFRLLPLSMLSIPSMVRAEEVKEKYQPDPSPWVEIVCCRKIYDWDTDKVIWECGTRFKFLRGAIAYCPKCYTQQPIGPEHRDLITGIEVK